MAHNPTRLEQIQRCVDEMEALDKYPDPKNCLLQTLGQMDWLDELHRLLYEEQDDAATDRMGFSGLA